MQLLLGGPCDNSDPRPKHRALGRRRRRGMGGGRQAGRQAQPDLVDLRRARRLLGVVDLVGHGAVHAAGRLRHRRRRASSTWSRCRRWSAPSCGFRTRSRPAKFGGRNWTIVSALLLLIPTLLTLYVMKQPGHVLHHVHDRRGVRRLRRRQLRLVDDEHQRLLPAAAQGLGAGPERRRRQHRRAGHPARRPAGDRHGQQHRARNRLCHLPCADRTGRRRRRAVHGQPAQPAVQPRRHGRGVALQALLGDELPVHRHVRILHRVLVRLRSGAADQLPGRRRQCRAGVAARRADRVHRAAARLDLPAVRRQAVRPHRRRQGDAVHVRRDDLRGGRPGRPPACSTTAQRALRRAGR